ncbi:MAG TPA: OsmC family protein [Ktedonobacterales bacterium]|jgi:uncharacterized OsmC-like protein
MAQPAVRQYDVAARSTDIFGRVLASVRDHHYIVDGPVHNGCPGEEVTPSELFLSAVASCGVELLQTIARAQSIPLTTVSVAIRGTMDPAHPVRPDVNLFNAVHLQFHLGGVTQDQAETLIDAFRHR